MTNKNTHNFTLVELLVVIAIISILAGMLLPALENALGSARAVTCMNNRKQFAIVINMYSDENSGYFPHLYRNEAGYVSSQTRNWYEVFFQNEYIEKNISGKKSTAGTTYWMGFLACPECETPRVMSGSAMGTDYAINDRVMSQNGGAASSGFKIQTVKSPSETYFSAEAVEGQAYLKWYWGNEQMSFPHQEKAVMQYVAGNASTLHETDVNPVDPSGSPSIIEWRGF
ncbi:MAG: type II secretion system protein [Planctomycetota bacterium]|jgi:prepilin-type N-terminal cleavage/methylation domain-containing protein